jgi:hypothetical protein
VTVVIVIAAIAVVAAVVFVAIGRGGQLSTERSDYAPLELGPLSATDVALLRPPTALWGYSVQATDEAFERIAESIRERDVRIVALEQLVTDLGRESGPLAIGGSYASAPYSPAPYFGARHRRDAPETNGGWQTGPQPTAEWAPKTEPTAEWPAGPEPTADWPSTPEPTADWPSPTPPTSPSPPPEQSHD